MTSILVAAVVGVLAFGSGMVGLYLQKRVPERHMSGGSKDMILAVIGLVSLLLALVLGTLVGKTYEFFTTQKSEVETMASRVLLVDPRAIRPRGEAGARQAERRGTQSYGLFWRGVRSSKSMWL